MPLKTKLNAWTQLTARRAQRGFTLVELMIVVAVIGVLASVAGVSYIKYMKSAKISKLKQYAMEVANAQEQYKSQNSQYLNLKNKNYVSGMSSTNKKLWENLLGFSKKGILEQGIVVATEAGAPSDTCSICEGVTPSGDTIWYAVVVTQDFKSGGNATTVILHNELESPVVLNEGE